MSREDLIWVEKGWFGWWTVTARACQRMPDRKKFVHTTYPVARFKSRVYAVEWAHAYARKHEARVAGRLGTFQGVDTVKDGVLR